MPNLGNERGDVTDKELPERTLTSDNVPTFKDPRPPAGCLACSCPCFRPCSARGIHSSALSGTTLTLFSVARHPCSQPITLASSRCLGHCTIAPLAFCSLSSGRHHSAAASPFLTSQTRTNRVPLCRRSRMYRTSAPNALSTNGAQRMLTNTTAALPSIVSSHQASVSTLFGPVSAAASI